MISDAVLTEDVDDGVPVVAARGELDLHSAPRLSRELTEACTDGVTGLILDLTHVEFIDSAILGVMLGAARRLEHHGCRLIVVARDPHIRQVIEITGLHRFFEVVASRAQARAAL